MLPVASEPAAQTPPAASLRAVVARAVPAGEPLLLGVSGGSDSVALLAAALDVFGPGRLHVLHVDHGLRTGSASDARFVRELASTGGVPCTVLSAAPSPADPGRGETAARRRRLRAFAAGARRAGGRWLLLAHHRDDDDETLLLRAWRGHVGDRARVGIPACRRHEDGLLLLRPFVCGVSPPGRETLAALRRAAGWPCVEDETNLDLSVPRNRARAVLARADGGERLRLLALRTAARKRLEAGVLAAAARLEEGLAAEGLGFRLGRKALDGAAPAELAEVLRLLGGCLERRRRFDPRASVLARLDATAFSPGRTLVLPATPSPLRLAASADALHAADEPLSQAQPAAAVLGALLAEPLYF